MPLQRLAKSLIPAPHLAVGVGLVVAGLVVVSFDRTIGIAFVAVGALDLAWYFSKSRGK